MATKVKSRVSSSVKLGVVVALFIAVVAAAGVYYTVPKIKKVFDGDSNFTKWSYLDESLGGNTYYPNKTMPKTNPLYLDGKGGVQTIKVVPGQQISIKLKTKFLAKKIRFAFDTFQVPSDPEWQTSLPDLEQVVYSFTGPHSADKFSKKSNFIFSIPADAQVGDKFDLLAGMVKKKNKPQIKWAGVDDWSFLRYEVVALAPATAELTMGKNVSNTMVAGNNVPVLDFALTAVGGDVKMAEASFKYRAHPAKDVEFRLYEKKTGVAVTDWGTASMNFNTPTDVVIQEGKTKWFTMKINTLTRLVENQAMQFCVNNTNFVIQDMASATYGSLSNNVGLNCVTKVKP